MAYSISLHLCLFYVHWTFRTWAIIVAHNSLFFVVRCNVCRLTVPFSSFSVIQMHKLVTELTSCFPFNLLPLMCLVNGKFFKISFLIICPRNITTIYYCLFEKSFSLYRIHVSHFLSSWKITLAGKQICFQISWSIPFKHTFIFLGNNAYFSTILITIHWL